MQSIKVHALAVYWCAAVFFGCVGGAMSSACTPAQRQDAKQPTKDALSMVQTLCVLANTFLPSAEIATVCGIEKEAAAFVEPLLQAHKLAAQRELAASRPSASASAAPPASSENVSKAPPVASSAAPAASSSAPKAAPPKKK
jgi:hypothetical protein